MWKCPKCGREFKNNNQDHYCGEKPVNIDDYIAAQSEDFQAILSKVRATIRAAAPDAIEKISWSMPTFWQRENLIHFAAFKKHIGIYPGDMTDSPFDERLAGYRRTKGAIQFPLDKPIDYGLISDVARWRVSCVEGRQGRHNVNGLLENLEKIHTTELGDLRIRKNLELETIDAVSWCIKRIEQADSIVRKGKNWYVCDDEVMITINAHSYTVITAHKRQPAEMDNL